MNKVLMTLGEFRFAVDTAAYTRLQKTIEYVWASHPVLLDAPNKQFTRKGDTSITMEGTIYPYMVGGKGLEQMPKLEAMGDAGKPYLLTSGRGDVWGYFGIVRLGETHTEMDADGLPKAIGFTLELTKTGSASS